MDPFTTHALADRKDLLVQKVISLAEWRTEVAALHDRALAARPAPAPAAAADDTDYDETMAHIARERARIERKPRARAIAANEPAPVTAAAELTDADYDQTMALIARKRRS